jgi:Phosphotransferase enzyme family
VVRRRAADHASALDEVTTPVLVHFDLHDGNILVDTGDTARITGLIDAERALWGDPLADFVCLALLDDIHRDKEFLAGYREAGGPVTLDGSSPVRLALYRSYMYLIFLVEAGIRQYPASVYEYLSQRVAPALASELDLLAARHRVPAFAKKHHPGGNNGTVRND